jgi:hypothetical protein
MECREEDPGGEEEVFSGVLIPPKQPLVSFGFLA